MIKVLIFFLILFVPVHGALADTQIKGALEQGALIVGKASPGAGVFLNGEAIQVGESGDFVIGFDRDADLTHTLRVVHGAGNEEVIPLTLQPQNYDIERVDGLPPRTVTIPEEERIRRARERARVAEARSFKTSDLYWTNGFVMPAEGRISGVYGSQRILNGQPRSPHYGLDVAGPVGTPVFAPASGIVRLAAADFLLEGGIIIIDHGFGVTSTLFHLSAVDIEEGQFIQQGERVGAIGATGRASGPHVDWRVNWGDVRLDPALALARNIKE